jgi:hemerythrin
MTQLKWDEQLYGTGVAHLDEQHQELFDGLNSLTAFLNNTSVHNDAESQKKVIELLYFLGEYALRHFKDEEKVFARCDHPLADVNKEAHQFFFKKFFKYNDKLINHAFSHDLLLELHAFLNFWLIDHIMKIDSRLRDFGERPSMELYRRSAKKKGVFTSFLALFQKK